MKSAKKNIGCVVSLIVVISAIVCFFVWMNYNMKYYVEAYKPVGIVNSNNLEKLQDRFVEYTISNAILYMEWNTYDNKKINKSPYKLFIKTKPNTHEVESISILDISIVSSLKERSYQFSDKFPIYVYQKMELDIESINSKKFEPAFHFNYEANEEIEVIIKLEVIHNGIREENVIRDTFKPVKIKHYAPLV